MLANDFAFAAYPSSVLPASGPSANPNSHWLSSQHSHSTSSAPSSSSYLHQQQSHKHTHLPPDGL